MNKTSAIQLWCVTLFTGASLVIIPLDAEAQTTIQRDPARTSEQSGDAVGSDRIRATEAERVRANDERARATEAERMRANDDRRSDRHRDDHRGEMYVAGFGGVTFGHNFDDVERTGAGAGLTQDDIGLSNSIVYGGKLGYFLPDRMSWLGFEVEGFNTTPHLEQQGQIPGSHLRVTTVAFNVVARAQMACEDARSDTRDRDVGDRSRGTSADRHHRNFCRLQPYIGAGPGVFFANASNGTSSSDNGVVGLNGMAGVRYFFTEQVALFGEYKYNSATFEFDNVSGTGPLKGDYSASHVVGGLSFHF